MSVELVMNESNPRETAPTVDGESIMLVCDVHHNNAVVGAVRKLFTECERIIGERSLQCDEDVEKAVAALVEFAPLVQAGPSLAGGEQSPHRS